MKKLMLIILIICMVPIIGNAKDYIVNDYRYNTGNFPEDECVNNDCILLFAYSNKVLLDKDIYGDQPIDYYGAYIYYSFSKEDFFVTSKTCDSVSCIKTKYFNDGGIHFDSNEKKDLIEKGKAPSGVFINTSWAKGLCIGSKDYCEKKDDGRLGTNFEGSSTLDYNYMNNISIYSGPDLSKTSCEIIISKKDTFVEEWEIQTKKDFNNYLTQAFKGYPVPNFVLESDQYNKAITNANSNAEKKYNECIKEYETKCENGELDSEICDNFKETLENLKEETQIDAEDIFEYYENQVPGPEEITGCTSLLGSPSDAESPAYYLNVVFKVLRYVAIVILIVLSTMDFVGAVAAQDDDAIKKATNKVIKRLILCVIIFVLPTLIEFVLQLIHDSAIDTCEIGSL